MYQKQKYANIPSCGLLAHIFWRMACRSAVFSSIPPAGIGIQNCAQLFRLVWVEVQNTLQVTAPLPVPYTHPILRSTRSCSVDISMLCQCARSNSNIDMAFERGPRASEPREGVFERFFFGQNYGSWQKFCCCFIVIWTNWCLLLQFEHLTSTTCC